MQSLKFNIKLSIFGINSFSNLCILYGLYYNLNNINIHLLILKFLNDTLYLYDYVIICIIIII